MGTVNNTEATQLSAREKDAVRTLPWRSLSTKAAFCERYYLVWRGPGEPRATCCQLTGNTSGTPDILLRSEWHKKKKKATRTAAVLLQVAEECFVLCRPLAFLLRFGVLGWVWLAVVTSVCL